MGRSGTSAIAVDALFSHFCYVGGFGDLVDSVVPTVRGVSGDVVTVYGNAFCALRARRRERVISFSVHCPRNIHQNKKILGTLIC